MDMGHFVVRLVIAIVCGIVGNMLIPRQVPGKFLGLVLVGLGGVWLGELGYQLIRSQTGFTAPFLQWRIENVQIIPAIIGSAIVIYVVTSFVSWGRYSK